MFHSLEVNNYQTKHNYLISFAKFLELVRENFRRQAENFVSRII